MKRKKKKAKRKKYMIALLMTVQDYKNYIVLYKETPHTIYYMYIKKKKRKNLYD
jgi:hypothetical protein